MKLGYKTEKTKLIEKLAEFYGLEPKTVSNQINQETKLSNLQIKKAYWSIINGLPYYDLNELIRMLCIELSNYNYLCRFTPCYSIDSDGKTTQNLECICNGKKLFSLRAGVDGINDILQQIGFEKRLEEPKTFLQLLVWKENI